MSCFSSHAAGTSYPNKGFEIRAANVKVPTDIAYENPLIVVAPASSSVSFFVFDLLDGIETVCDSSQQSVHTGSNCQSLDSAAATAAVLDGSPVGWTKSSSSTRRPKHNGACWTTARHRLFS